MRALVRLARRIRAALARGIGRATGVPRRWGGGPAGGRSRGPHLRHAWQDIEVVGRVHVQECRLCGRTRVRVR